MFEEIVELYYQRTKKHFWEEFKELNRMEKVRVIIFIASAIPVLVSQFFCDYVTRLFWLIIYIGIFIGFVKWADSDRKKNISERRRNYNNENLEVLRMILKRDECNCYSLQQLEVLMERCEDVLKRESPYVKLIGAAKEFVSAILIPVVFVFFNKYVEAGIDWDTIIGIMVIIFMLLLLVLAFVCLAEMVSELINVRKRRVSILYYALWNLKLFDANKLPDSVNLA